MSLVVYEIVSSTALTDSANTSLVFSVSHPDYIRQMEILLTGFTDKMADMHINDNKMWFPDLK